MPIFPSSRNIRFFAQVQSSFLSFNNTSGTWANTGAKLIRLPQDALNMNRVANYTPFPAVTGDRSTLAGIRGRKNATWEVRGIPFIPSGAAGTVPDLDPILQCAFGAAATVVATTSATYNLSDTGFFPLSLFSFVHGFPTLTSRALWGGIVTKLVFNFNGDYVTVDVTGAGGYEIDSAGFAAFDVQAKAGLTTFPLEPTSPTVNGQPIAGFGTGYTATVDTQDVSLKMKAQTITFDTGLELIEGVYGSPYAVGTTGGTRSVTLALTAYDDDTSALNDLKTKADTDNTTINATITAGVNAGSIATWTVKNIQPNAFNLKDNGTLVEVEFPASMAHESSVGALDDLILALT